MIMAFSLFMVKVMVLIMKLIEIREILPFSEYNRVKGTTVTLIATLVTN